MGRFIGKFCLVDPAHVPSFDVVPLFFDLVVGCPEETTLQVLVPGFDDAS